MSKIIGIDLGTTNSCVAVIENNKPVVIINMEGFPTTPSIVAFTDNGNGERKVGESAKRQAALNPVNTIYSIKRFMGRSFDEVGEEVKNVPYNIVRGQNNTPRVQIGDRQYTPQEVSAMILQKMKRTAEEYLGHEVKEAVITVPAYFNDAQRQATIEAGAIAGLEVKRIVNEPTAAALAYGLDKLDKDIRIAVYDLGGGTFDISILELGGGVFDVKSTNGDTHLGGDDFDKVIIDWMAGEFMKEFPSVDPRKDPLALQRLRDEAEKAKKELSSSTQYQVMIPYFFPVDGMARNLVCSLSRAKFEQLCEHLVQRTLEPCKQALKDAGVDPSQIDEVILVGGSTRIPRIQQAVEQFFGKKPNKTVNPDEAVALGAAVQGGILNKDIKGMVLLDVTPLSLGLETVGGMMTRLIEAQTTIPVSKSEVFTTAADNQTSVEIHVLQGERPLAIQNRTIGRFHLEGIPPAKRNTPKVRVKFDIDANGVLSVTATDEGTGKEQKIRIEASSGLSKEEIERMKNEAKSNEDADKKVKEEAEKLNQADGLIYQTESQLTEYADKLSEANKTAIESALGELKEAHKVRDIAGIDAAMAKLNTAWQTASTEIYNASNEQQTTTNQQTEQNTQNENKEGGNSNVTDADYEEVK